MSDDKNGETLNAGEVAWRAKPEIGRTSLFDRLLITRTWPLLFVPAAFLIKGIEWLVGPMSDFVVTIEALVLTNTTLALALAIALGWPCEWLLQRLHTVAHDADPTRTYLIPTPTLLQRGYERLRGSKWGSAVLLVPSVALFVGPVVLYTSYVGLFDDFSWWLVFFGLVMPWPSITWEVLVSLMAGPASGVQDQNQN